MEVIVCPLILKTQSSRLCSMMEIIYLYINKTQKETEAHNVSQSPLVHTHRHDVVYVCPAHWACPPAPSMSRVLPVLPSAPCPPSWPSSACVTFAGQFSLSSGWYSIFQTQSDTTAWRRRRESIIPRVSKRLIYVLQCSLQLYLRWARDRND